MPLVLGTSACGFDSRPQYSTCCGTQTGKAANFKRSCLRVRLPPAVLRFKQPSGGTSVDTQAPECRAPHPKNGAACEFNSRLGYFSKRHCRCDRCPTDRHEVGVLGSIPRPATQCKQQRGWASAQPGLISQDRRVRPPDPLLTKVEYANRQSGKHERLVILQVRLLSRLLQSKHDRVVQRRRRLRDKQETDGSIPSVITE